MHTLINSDIKKTTRIIFFKFSTDLSTLSNLHSRPGPAVMSEVKSWLMDGTRIVPGTMIWGLGVDNLEICLLI